MTQPNNLPLMILRRDADTSHQWGNDNEWTGDPKVSDWELSPPDGELWAVKAVEVTISEDFVMHATHGVKGIIDTGVDTTLVEFKKFSDFIARSTEWFKLDLSMPSSNDITGNVIRLSIPFEKVIYLWSTAGLDGSSPKTYTDINSESQVKLRKMLAYIEGDSPYRNGSGGDVEVSVSRYYYEAYEDPDW